MENDFDYLVISGLKHFHFCKRRWALRDIECQWAENALTLDGHYLHERVHDRDFTELRGRVLYSRGMPIRSHALKVTGECDLLELIRDESGIPIRGRDGKWLLYPVEYKHGKPDERGADELQLCAQAICLEEMFVTDISKGALYYAALRRRVEVAFTEELRKNVKEDLAEMYRLYERRYTPKAKWTKACKSCSMYEICRPDLTKGLSASEYVRRTLEDEI